MAMKYGTLFLTSSHINNPFLVYPSVQIWISKQIKQDIIPNCSINFPYTWNN
jgi:hypothetical protein